MHAPDDDSRIDAESATHRPARGDALVVFGLTGDLGETKLFPALAELARAGRLGIPVVAVGRSEVDDDELRAQFRHSVERARPELSAWVDDVDLVYVRGDASEHGTFDDIAARLDGATTPVVYAALPPDLLADLTESATSGALPDGVRLVVEKPFGHDADSARELWNEMTWRLPAERIFIVDHFLAKSAVENLATFRHANAVIDDAMRSGSVEEIRIELYESETLDDRAGFYDDVGVIADVVQNHLLQTLALVTMDRPDDGSARAHQVARRDALRRVVPVERDAVVLARYDGYLDHDDVVAANGTATFADLSLRIDHPRWADTAVRLVTGKALDDDRFIVDVRFRPTGDLPANRLRFVLGDDPRIELSLWVLGDDPEHEPTPTVAQLSAPADHDLLGDYATLLDDALDGSHRHIASIETVLAAWNVVDPLAGERATITYPPGSSGPTGNAGADDG